MGRIPRQNASSPAVATYGDHVPQGAIPGIVRYGLVALLLASPFFRGLFFPKEQLVALIYTLGLFVLWWWHKYCMGDVTFLHTPLEWAGLALVGAYVLSTFGALNMRSAIQEDMKNLMYFLVLWLTLETTRTDRDRKRVLVGIFVAGVLLALLGIGAAAGIPYYNGAITQGRLASGLQYPNSLAAHLTMSSLLGLTLATVEQPMWVRISFIAGSSVSLLAFIFTFSRAAWLLYPMAGLGLTLLVPAAHRMRALIGLVVSVGAAATGIRLFSTGLTQHAAGLIWGAVGVTLAAAVAGSFLVEGFLRLRRRYQALVVVGLLGVAFVAAPWLAKRIPSDLSQRIAAITYGSHELQERFQFLEDALKITRDHLPLGAGGGGFAATYQAYQSYGYTSTQVHNHFAQVLLEAGVSGLAAFQALWVFVLYAYVKHLQGTSPLARLLGGGALAAVFALGVHSSIDFNLTLSAVSLPLWSLWGVIGGFEARPEAKTVQGRRRSAPTTATPAVVATVGALALTLFAGRLWLAARAGEAAARDFTGGNLRAAQEGFRRAIALDPFTASFRMDLAQVEVILAGAQPEPAVLRTAKGNMQEALRLESTNPSFETAYGAFLLRTGEINGGLRAFERAVKLGPFRSEGYENLAKAYTLAARASMHQGQKQQATDLLAKVSPVTAQLAARHNAAPSFAYPWQVPPPTSPILLLYQGEAFALMGQEKEAEPLLKTASQDPKVAAEAQLWLGILAEKKGDVTAARGFLDKAYAANAGLQREYLDLMTLVPQRED